MTPSTPASSNHQTQYLDRPGGRIAYDVTGPADGPLVVCLPGIGDLRHSYREAAAELAGVGIRVAVADLRGHGGSSSHWPSYATSEVAGDLLALVEELGGEAVVVGNSMAGGAAVLAASQDPTSIVGVVLICPFTRPAELAAVQRLGMKLVTGPLIGRSLWLSYWPSLFGVKPADLAERRRTLAANLREPGRYAAVRAMLATPAVDLTEVLPTITVPALVVMGTADPDFTDPTAEAHRVAALLPDAVVELVPGAGHYPHAEYPELVGKTIATFVEEHMCHARG